MVACWALQHGAEHAIDTARACGMPDAVLVYALHLAEEEADYVKGEARQMLHDGGAPIPAWLMRGSADPERGQMSPIRWLVSQLPFDKPCQAGVCPAYGNREPRSFDKPCLAQGPSSRRRRRS